MANATTQIIIQGRDQLSSVIASASQRFGTEMQRMQGSALDLRDALAGVAGAAALNQVKDEFTGYDTAVRDMAKVTDESAQIIAAKLSVIPAELGNMTELTQGYYQVLSAGVSDPVAAMDTLTASAQAAKAAHLEQADVVRGITKLMAGYAGEIGSASTAADLLFAIEKQGQTEFAELIPVIGDVAAVSHEMGVSQNEMGAAMAVISNTAGSTSEAATQYRAALVNLMKPTDSMQKALDGLGVSSGKAAVEQFGLAGTVDRLTQYAAKAGIPLGKLFESSEALLAMAAMSRNGFEGYNTALDAMATKAGGAERAFSNWREGAQATDDLLRSTVSNTMVKLGEQIMPTANAAVREFSDFVSSHQDDIAGAFGLVVKYGSDIASVVVPALRDAGGVITDSVLPPTVAVLETASSILDLVPSEYQSSVGAGIIGYALLGPQGAVIAASIAAIDASMNQLSQTMWEMQGGTGNYAQTRAQLRSKGQEALGQLMTGQAFEAPQPTESYRAPVTRTVRMAVSPRPTAAPPKPSVVSGGGGGKKASADKALDLDGYGTQALTAMQAESQRTMDLLRAQLDAEAAMALRGYEAQTLSLEAYYAERRRIIEEESQAEIQQQEQIVSRAQAEKERLAKLKPDGARGTEQISDQTRSLNEKIADAQAKIEILKAQTSTSLADLSSEQAKAARERITQAMSDAQAVISATEQSLESRVVTGLETESTARAKLKAMIQEQGAALEQDLVPQIERMMLVASNPKARAELQAMLDKIREMAAEAKTQTWADGLSQGVKDYATEASDAFQTARDAAVSSMSGIEDAIVNTMTGARVSVASTVQAIAADFARLAIRQSITQPLASGVGNVIQQLLGGGSSWAGVNTSWSGAATTSASIMGNSGYGLAGGGRVTGPGTDTSDSVPIDASRDEYVIKAASARKIGYDRLDYANVHGELPERHAHGGIVGRGDRRSPVDRSVDRSTIERIIGGNTVERLMQSDRTVDRSTIERIMPSIHAHANTIRDTPTPFSFSGLQPFAKGGVFAEASPEAVMPLTRTSDGRLGVASTGQSGQQSMNVRVEMVNQGQPQQVQSVTPKFDAEGMVLKIITADLARNGPVARSMAGAYNLKRTV